MSGACIIPRPQLLFTSLRPHPLGWVQGLDALGQLPEACSETLAGARRAACALLSCGVAHRRVFALVLMGSFGLSCALALNFSPSALPFSSRQTTPCLPRSILSRMPKSCQPCKGCHMLLSRYVLSAANRAETRNKRLPLMLQHIMWHSLHPCIHRFRPGGHWPPMYIRAGGCSRDRVGIS